MLKNSFSKGTWIAASIIALSNVAYAQTNEYLVAPHCLTQKLNDNAKVIASNQGYDVLQVNSNAMDEIATIAHANKSCGGFFNVSNKLQATKGSLNANNPNEILKAYTPKKAKAMTSQSYSISHQETVNQLIEQVDKDKIWSTLTQLTSFYNRSGRTNDGVEAANWVKQQFDNMAQQNNRNDVNSYFVDTDFFSYKQPSVVTVLGKDLPGEAVVLGAHMDTLSGNMPGADDDGSGTSSLMEVARILLSNNVELKQPVYLVWYAAEEYGLYGSQSVVDDFIRKNIPVKAVLQMDMTGYRHNGESKIWMITDYVDAGLTDFVADLAGTYAKVDVGRTRCNYACSDHASWSREGFTAAFPVETKFGQEDPYIHSSNDKMDYVSVDHMASFTKIGLGFAIELAS